jgi:Lysylphosphatidylglycerol synthase TM region
LPPSAISRFRPLAVAYAETNIASAIPITPGGLGVIEVMLVAVTVGFGAPRPTAVLAVLGYRIVNYRLPLFPARWPISASGSARRRLTGLITRILLLDDQKPAAIPLLLARIGGRRRFSCPLVPAHVAVQAAWCHEAGRKDYCNVQIDVHLVDTAGRSGHNRRDLGAGLAWGDGAGAGHLVRGLRVIDAGLQAMRAFSSS